LTHSPKTGDHASPANSNLEIYDIARGPVLFFFFSLTLQPPWALASNFQFHDHFTGGMTPWMSDQLVAIPLPKYRTTQTQNKHIPNIHASLGIRTHDTGFLASEDSTYLRLLGYRDRQLKITLQQPDSESV
jgi:hypothetical protein